MVLAKSAKTSITSAQHIPITEGTGRMYPNLHGGTGQTALVLAQERATIAHFARDRKFVIRRDPGPVTVPVFRISRRDFRHNERGVSIFPIIPNIPNFFRRCINPDFRIDAA